MFLHTWALNRPNVNNLLFNNGGGGKSRAYENLLVGCTSNRTTRYRRIILLLKRLTRARDTIETPVIYLVLAKRFVKCRPEQMYELRVKSLETRLD